MAAPFRHIRRAGQNPSTKRSEAWEGFNGRIKLDTLAKILNVGKKTEGIDGSKVFGEWQEGNIEKIADYCNDDVQLTLDIYNKLTYNY